MQKPTIEANNVSKAYQGHKALDGLSVQIPKGSIYGLLGPNGAGKTTFIRLLNQITAPDTGEILFDGEPLKPSDVHRIGYLPEERGLYKKMKVGEQAMYLARLKGLSDSQAKAKLKYWFEKFEIGPWWNKKIEELSKGMAQKIQFITTVLHDPELLIFDEPFSGFDPINTNLIKAEIQELRKNGATVIFSTHRMESVEEICDHIALINKSKKVLEGSVEQIRNDYRSHRYVISGIPASDAMDLPPSMLLESTKTNKGQVSLTVKVDPEITTNQLLHTLLPQMEIHDFKEEIPSVNDIFIQRVQGISQD
ncbi:MAG: ABC transporter ATP-binding protein [Schleiferiaceae bacterium]